MSKKNTKKPVTYGDIESIAQYNLANGTHF